MNMDHNYREANQKNVSEVESAYTLREAWNKLYGEYPSTNTLAILWGKAVLETGRFKVGFWNYNFGNIKAKPGETYTMYDCGEELTYNHAVNLKRESPDLVSIVKEYTSKGVKMASVNFKAGHFQTRFRSYESLEDGAKSYIEFIANNKRYSKAFAHLKLGNPKEYSYALGEAGYYTANPDRYTTGVIRLFDEFIKRKEELLAWVPEDTKIFISPVDVMQEEFDTLTDNEKPKAEEEIDTFTNNEIPSLEYSRDEVTISESIAKEKLKSSGFGIIAVAAIAFATWIMRQFQGCGFFH